MPKGQRQELRFVCREYRALKDEKIVDIRKVYKNGVTDSVIDSYRSYLKQ